MAGEVRDGRDWWVLRGREAGVRSAAGDRQRGLSVQNAGAKKANSLSLNFITRVAPHCVNTLMILHAAHTLMMSAG